MTGRIGFRGGLAAAAGLGLALRALYLFTWGRHAQGVGDWFFFDWQANLLADGRGFIDPFRNSFEHVTVPSAAHPPLYPLALAAISLVGGHSELDHRALGLLCGVVTIVLVGLIGRRAGGGRGPGDRLGVLAAGLCAVYPLMIAADGALMSETLFGAFIAGMLLAAQRFRETPTAWRAAALGALVALAALTRAEALLFVPFLVLPLAWQAGAPRWRLGAIAVAACVVVLAPWTIRNYDAFGTFVPISTNDSTVIAGANCPSTYYGPDIGNWNFSCLPPRVSNNEADQAAASRRVGIDYALDHASRWPLVVPARLARLWDVYQPGRQLSQAEGRDRRTEKAGVVVYWLFLLLAIPGAIAIHRHKTGLLILLSPVAVVCVSAVFGYGLPRLRHSFEPALCVLAAAGALALAGQLWSRWTARTGSPSSPDSPGSPGSPDSPGSPGPA